MCSSPVRCCTETYIASLILPPILCPPHLRGCIPLLAPLPPSLPSVAAIYCTKLLLALQKVGTARWGLQVYDGSLDTDSMSTFIEAAASADAKNRTPLTRLPTVMARKAPKVKPPPPPPRPDAETAGAGHGEGGDAAGAGKYAGMDKEQILEAFRKKQAQKEVARRKAMDEEVRERTNAWVWFLFSR